MPEHQRIQQSKKPDTIFQKQATPVIQTPVSNPFSIIQRAKINPKSLTHADVMQLQRTIGNRAVAQLLSGIINSSTAQQETVQRQEIPEEEEPLQGKIIEPIQRQEIPEEEEPLQGKMAKTIQLQEIQDEEEPLQGKFAEPIQCQEIPEEEEPLQEKMIEPLQLQEMPEEEELLQGKMIETVQRQEIPEEEEPLQGKIIEPIQRQEIPEEEEPLQGKMIETVQRQEIPEEEEPLQGKFEDKPEIDCPSCFAAPIVQKQEISQEEGPLQGKMIRTVQRQEIPEEEEPLQPKSENNTGMPDNLKAGVESLSGIDMSDVRVHYDSSKPAKVGALAYTQGIDIHVAPGQEKHLPHEAWHVVQQAQDRVRPTFQMKGLGINDDPSLEHEADIMGVKTAQFFSVPDEPMLQGKSAPLLSRRSNTEGEILHAIPCNVAQRELAYEQEGQALTRPQVEYLLGICFATPQLSTIRPFIMRLAISDKRYLVQDIFEHWQQKRQGEKASHDYETKSALVIPLRNAVSEANRERGRILGYVGQDLPEDIRQAPALDASDRLFGDYPMTIDDVHGVPRDRQATGGFCAVDEDNLLLNRIATEVRPFHHSPHLALALSRGKLYVAGNTGAHSVSLAEAVRLKREIRERLQNTQYADIRIAFRNLGRTGGGNQTHGEMSIIQSIIDRFTARGTKPASQLEPQQSVMLSGNKLDCLKCHAAMRAFNEVIGPALRISLLSNGYHSEAPLSWTKPRWLAQNREASDRYEVIFGELQH